MPELTPLHPDHARAVLAFERENRAWFARSVSDRGDAFFDRFDEQFRASLAEQDSGACAFYVLAEADGDDVLGRFNLYGLHDGTADLGYRMAEHACGRGLATAAVGELCRLAATRHGLRTLRAATSLTNLASQRVLAKCDFTPTGPADPSALGGKPGTWFRRDVTRQPG
ncbi:ribosomal-protein-alanine N-acetyltransferase [Streptacidiphilus sp. MAP12-33]|uniref:GNAT family N-acetyltransferase n=1 Tax=Streptacidiphilus sp. MAP12-33 TaxID=3156266 RepID=UPI003515C347